jgi:2-methylcitrate dehydratase PrpD
MFGTMCKPLHAGKAAMQGVMAAQLASRGFSSSRRALEAECGLWALLGEAAKPEAALEGLGSDYQIRHNALKPYACGVVVHPVIDGALALRAHAPLENLAAVEVRAHPLVLALTGKTAPLTGLEGKFSVYHCVAAALARGACGPAEFADDLVRDPSLVELRGRVRVEGDDTLREDEAVVTTVLTDGRRQTHHVLHATGSAANPMSDGQLQAKYRSLAGTVLPPDVADRLAELVWVLDQVEDVGEVTRTASSPP